MAEHRLEADLRKSLTEHRAEVLGIPATQWDEGLAFLLMPALASYEAEAVTGQPAAGTEDFQQSIKRSTPAGSTFKGVPQHHRCGYHDVLPILWGEAESSHPLTQAANAARLQTTAQGCAPALQVRPEGGQSINRSMLVPTSKGLPALHHSILRGCIDLMTGTCRQPLLPEGSPQHQRCALSQELGLHEMKGRPPIGWP